MAVPGGIDANGKLVLPEGFLSHADVPDAVYAHVGGKHEGTVPFLASLDNGSTIAVPVDGLKKSSKANRKGETVDTWTVKDHNGKEYRLTDKIARQMAAELTHVREKKGKGIVWKIGHDGKNRLQLLAP